MTASLRDTYAKKALSQIPRILSLQDRNAFSPTYGCFKRTYWLDKVDDFPDALPQFGVLSLALAWGHEMPDNPYFQEERILEWTLSGMRYWTTIQHNDGSFDEFYPNERGWAGPTGFLLYGMLKSYMVLNERGAFPKEFEEKFFTACRKAADYLIAWDEHGVLANHHAMAVLPVFYAWHVLKDERFRVGYEKKLSEFLTFCNPEGWSLEYDGADIGYLSASVSFLGKIYKITHDKRLKDVMEKGVEFLSYFVYPDGYYAGSLGSRQTLHFYSHGCEVLAPEMPLAGKVADALLEALGEGKLVPAEIMPDRYLVYRVPEHLESYIDSGERAAGAPQLPYERQNFRKVFPEGRFWIEKRGNTYVVANAAKGGVLKVFDVEGKRQVLADCGVIGSTTKGTVLTSQWIDPTVTFLQKEDGFAVSGALHAVPANKLFTPMKMIIFRTVMLLIGWNTGLAYRMKGFIRRLLMLGGRPSGVLFHRAVRWKDDTLCITDTLRITGDVRFSSLQIGGDFSVRYVPQSRYFQLPELRAPGTKLSHGQLKTLNEQHRLQIERTIHIHKDHAHTLREVALLKGAMGLEYSEGRKTQRALTYRLSRRADEVIGAIRRHFSGSPTTLLDLGPADGKVLSKIQDAFPDLRCTGLEHSQELIDVCEDPRLIMVQGDAMHPPFADQSFDVVTASALIEHVSDPKEMLRELMRILRPGGIVIITTPDPFFERIATAIGHLPEEDHQETMTLPTLDKYLRSATFAPVELRKFMVSPWGMPGEGGVERLMSKMGLSFLLLNQLAVGKKTL